MELQGPPNSQDNIEKEKAGELTCSDFKVFKAILIKIGTGIRIDILTNGKNREPRKKPKYLWPIDFRQGSQGHSVGKE